MPPRPRKTRINAQQSLINWEMNGRQHWPSFTETKPNGSPSKLHSKFAIKGTPGIEQAIQKRLLQTLRPDPRPFSENMEPAFGRLRKPEG